MSRNCQFAISKLVLYNCRSLGPAILFLVILHRICTLYSFLYLLCTTACWILSYEKTTTLLCFIIYMLNQGPYRLVAEEGKSKCSWVNLDDISNTLVRGNSQLHQFILFCRSSTYSYYSLCCSISFLSSIPAFR